MAAPFRLKTREEKNLTSAEITWTEAQQCIDGYLQRPDPVRVYDPIYGTQTLKALRFDRDQIENLFTAEVTHLYLMFANSPMDSTNITIIAGGLVDPADDGGTLNTGLLYDFCEPCPHKCASNTP